MLMTSFVSSAYAAAELPSLRKVQLFGSTCRFKLAPNLRVPAGEPVLASINASHSLRAYHVR